MTPVSLYIHYPFCELKCPYCDFNSHVRDNVNQHSFLQAYLKEISFYDDYLKQKEISTVYFGGGTPSLMAPDMIAKILNQLNKDYKFRKNPEITIEANPSSSEINKFKSFKKAGINRISIGIQSFNDARLKFLGRKHSGNEAINAIEAAQQVFNEKVSFDLIYATKNQSLDNWKKELKQAVSYNLKHLSLYQLTIEKGTDFFNQVNRGKVKTANDEISEDMYFYTIDELKKYGLEKYETSNFASSGYESQHNLNYWRYGEYLGIGAGAHSRIQLLDNLSPRFHNGVRRLDEHGMTNAKKLDFHSIKNPYNGTSRMAIYNMHSPEKWLQQVEQTGNGIQKQWQLTKQEILEEILFMGLRTKEGINLNKFRQFFNRDLQEIFNIQKLDYLFEEGFLKLDKSHLSATEKGAMLHTSIYKKLIENSIL